MYVEKILLMLNASANFLYYCFSGMIIIRALPLIIDLMHLAARPTLSQFSLAKANISGVYCLTYDRVGEKIQIWPLRCGLGCVI